VSLSAHNSRLLFNNLNVVLNNLLSVAHRVEGEMFLLRLLLQYKESSVIKSLKEDPTPLM